jgi:hypothetical protein
LISNYENELKKLYSEKEIIIEKMEDKKSLCKQPNE